MTPGESVYGEKRVAIATTNAEGEEEKVEYRVWNPFRSKLAAGILGGLDNIHVSLYETLIPGWLEGESKGQKVCRCGQRWRLRIGTLARADLACPGPSSTLWLYDPNCTGQGWRAGHV